MYWSLSYHPTLCTESNQTLSKALGSIWDRRRMPWPRQLYIEYWWYRACQPMIQGVLAQGELASTDIISRSDFSRTMPRCTSSPSSPLSTTPDSQPSTPKIDPNLITEPTSEPLCHKGGNSSVLQPSPSNIQEEEAHKTTQSVSEPQPATTVPHGVNTPINTESNFRPQRITKPPRKYVPVTGTWDWYSLRQTGGDVGYWIKTT